MFDPFSQGYFSEHVSFVFNKAQLFPLNALSALSENITGAGVYGLYYTKKLPYGMTYGAPFWPRSCATPTPCPLPAPCRSMRACGGGAARGCSAVPALMARATMPRAATLPSGIDSSPPKHRSAPGSGTTMPKWRPCEPLLDLGEVTMPGVCDRSRSCREQQPTFVGLCAGFSDAEMLGSPPAQTVGVGEAPRHEVAVIGAGGCNVRYGDLMGTQALIVGSRSPRTFTRTRCRRRSTRPCAAARGTS